MTDEAVNKQHVTLSKVGYGTLETTRISDGSLWHEDSNLFYTETEWAEFGWTVRE